jgi:NAD(P)-dependent dehydrogenase (short-subunit alcohol dehydrogenase family)
MQISGLSREKIAPMDDFAGRVAIVTGAARGDGRRIVIYASQSAGTKKATAAT